MEAAGRRVCLTVALLGIPLGVLVAWFAHQSATEAADRDAASLFHAEAVTLEDASERRSLPGNPAPPVAVKWTGPNGIKHLGELQVPSGSAAGYEAQIWTTEQGEITSPPPSRAQLVIDAVFAGAKVMVGIGGAAFLAYQLLRYGLNRWRYRRWDRAWEDFGTRHSPG